MDDIREVVRILNGQLPDYFRPIIEFQEILKAHGYGVGQPLKRMEALKNNFYIATCDEATVAYYERLFDIKYNFGDSLDFRRLRILQKFNTIVPFSLEFLRDRLTELYGENGYILAVDPVALTLKIKITSDRYGAVDLLYDLLWDIIPAHIQIMANQQTSNFVPGRVYVGGQVSGSTWIQTIHYHTITNVKSDTNTIGAVSGFSIQTIEAGGREDGSI